MANLTLSNSRSDIEQNKLWAVIAYIGILFLIPLLAKKDSPYAQYHAKQGMVLFLVSVVIGFIAWIPLIGWLIALGVVALWITGVVNALSGKMTPLPIIGQYAEKLNI
ncbi:hypothetical protein HYW32_00510 [Candidatus Berkelbacteria bacterium]|nr:hypothetical protein [Candidatus Berkelbacteria bacterium]